jgi:hypothetical protein
MNSFQGSSPRLMALALENANGFEAIDPIATQQVVATGSSSVGRRESCCLRDGF